MGEEGSYICIYVIVVSFLFENQLVSLQEENKFEYLDHCFVMNVLVMKTAVRHDGVGRKASDARIISDYNVNGNHCKRNILGVDRIIT